MSEEPKKEPDREQEIRDILSSLGEVLDTLSPRQAPPPEKAAPPPQPKAPPPEQNPQPTPAPAEPQAPPGAAQPAPKIELSAPPAAKAAEKAQSPGIELGPRAGFLNPSKKPSEINPVAPPPPAKAPPAAAPTPSPAPAPVAAQAPAGPVSIPALSIPAGTPKDQIRRVAFLYSGQDKAKCLEFIQFIGDVALKVSKKPLYLETVLVLEVVAGVSSTGVLEQAKAKGAVAVLGVLAGLKEAHRKDLEEVFENAEFFFRMIAPEDVAKRPLAIDLVVDMMLLKPA